MDAGANFIFFVLPRINFLGQIAYRHEPLEGSECFLFEDWTQRQPSSTGT
jgi:hypothetical protein